MFVYPVRTFSLPFGRSPAIDPTHPGMPRSLEVHCHQINKNMVNIVTGRHWNADPAFVFDGKQGVDNVIGRWISGGPWRSFRCPYKSGTTANMDSGTLGVIFRTSDFTELSAGGHGFIVGTSEYGSGLLFTMDSDTRRFWVNYPNAPPPYTVQFGTDNFFFTPNTAYFLAATWRPNFFSCVIVNLDNHRRKVWFNLVAPPSVNPGPVGEMVFGSELSNSNGQAARIARAMCGQGYIGNTKLLKWADDPWSFWLPPRPLTIMSTNFMGRLPPVLESELTLSDRVIDNGLKTFRTECNRISVCTKMPVDYAEALTTTRGTRLFDPITNPAFTVAGAGPSGGRAVTSTAIANGSISAAGVVSHWAVLNTTASRLLAAGALAGGGAVSVGQSFSLAAFTIQVFGQFGTVLVIAPLTVGVPAIGVPGLSQAGPRALTAVSYATSSPVIGTTSTSTNRINFTAIQIALSRPIFGTPATSGLAVTPPIITLDASSDLGSSSSDNKTNQSVPLFNWVLAPNNVIPGAVLKLYRTGTLIATHTLSQVEIDTGDIDLGLAPEPDGTWSYTGTITVTGLTSALSTACIVTINTSMTPPVLSLDPASDTSTVGDNQTSNRLPQIRLALVGATAGTKAFLTNVDGINLNSATVVAGDVTNGYVKIAPTSNLPFGVNFLRGYFENAAVTQFSVLSEPAYALTIARAPVIAYTPAAQAQVGTAYTGATPTVTGSTATPFVFSISAGSLPPGLSISSTTGVISGTPTGSGAIYNNIKIRCTDTVGEFSETAAFYINVTSSYTPAAIASAISWWDASDTASISATSGRMNTITDKVGTHTLSHFSTNGARTGQHTINGRNTLSSIATDMNFDVFYYQWTGFPVTKATLYMVVQVDECTGQYSSILDYGQSGPNFLWVFNNSAGTPPLKYGWNGSVGNVALPYDGIDRIGGPHILKIQWDVAGTGPVKFAQDNVLVANLIGYTAMEANSHFRFFSNHFSASNTIGMRLGEAVLCNSWPTALEEETLMFYLKNKWNTP